MTSLMPGSGRFGPQSLHHNQTFKFRQIFAQDPFHSVTQRHSRSGTSVAGASQLDFYGIFHNINQFNVAAIRLQKRADTAQGFFHFFAN
jgi:hypothetical protein